MNKIWIMKWSTESGDSGVCGYWTSKPIPSVISNFLQDTFPDDFEADTLYHNLEQLEEIKVTSM